jgi:GntR family transcriptional regulator
MAMVSGSGPLYQQVVAQIRSHIEGGLWAEGDQIPSEREMCELYQISRTTVRLAIAEAVTDGLLLRVHGKGTFVANSKIRQPLVKFTAFAETLESQGLTPSTRVVAIHSQPADMAMARLLGLKTGADVITFHLVGLGDDEPMALYTSTVPARLGEVVRAKIGRWDGTQRYYLVNTVLAEVNGWSYLKAEQSYEAVLAGPEAMRLLNLPRRAPLFRVDSLFENPDGEPVEFRRAIYRADKYQFQVTRHMYFGKGRDGL